MNGGYPMANEDPSPNCGEDFKEPVTVGDIKEAIASRWPATALEKLYDERGLEWATAQWWWKHFHGQDADLGDAFDREYDQRRAA